MHIVLHIGTEKTGTTSIQRWLYANQSVLRQHGIGLLENVGQPNNMAVAACFTRELSAWGRNKGFKTKTEEKLALEPILQGMTDQLKRFSDNGFKMLIVTSEHFSARLKSRQEIENLRQYFNSFGSTKVICFVRQQSSLARSLYATYVRGAYSETPEVFADWCVQQNHYFNFENLAENWAAVFGSENLKFELLKEGGEQDAREIMLNYLRTIENTPDFEKMVNVFGAENQKIGALTCSAIRAVNRKFQRLPVNSHSGRINKQLSDLAAEALREVDYEIEIDPFQKKLGSLSESNLRFQEAWLSGEEINQRTSFKTSSAKTIEKVKLEESIFNLSHSLTGMISQRNKKTDLLTIEDGDNLRDVALKIIQDRPLGKKDAETLLRIALRAKPNGSWIKRLLRTL